MLYFYESYFSIDFFAAVAAEYTASIQEAKQSKHTDTAVGCTDRSKLQCQARKHEPLAPVTLAKTGRNDFMKEKKRSQSCADCRMGKVGGQAVLEGVMMKAGEKTVTTCRKEDGSLVVYDDSFVSVRKKNKFLNLPIIRGVVNFVEMMALSVKTLSNSADALGIEEEDGKAEKWMKKHLGVRLTDVIMVVGVILGVVLALGLFMFLPNFLAQQLNNLTYKLFTVELGLWIAIIEGIVKVIIFLLYLWLVSLMPDIRRTFMYHGAEHKTIACFEAGEELTPENAKKHRRFHPRCGTSFMFFMILLGIVAGLLLRLVLPEDFPVIAYSAIRLLILPLIVGIGYEFIMYAGKHNNIFVRILSAPGLWVQRLTTKEPTEDMLEVAIISTKCALREEFPEFMEFYLARPWEPKPEEAAEPEAENTVPDGAGETAEAPSDITEDGEGEQ